MPVPQGPATKVWIIAALLHLILLQVDKATKPREQERLTGKT